LDVRAFVVMVKPNRWIGSNKFVDEHYLNRRLALADQSSLQVRGTLAAR
jgi:hypothetical protein